MTPLPDLMKTRFLEGVWLLEAPGLQQGDVDSRPRAPVLCSPKTPCSPGNRDCVCGGGEPQKAKHGVLASAILALGWSYPLLGAGCLVREIRAEGPCQALWHWASSLSFQSKKQEMC